MPVGGGLQRWSVTTHSMEAFEPAEEIRDYRSEINPNL